MLFKALPHLLARWLWWWLIIFSSGITLLVTAIIILLLLPAVDDSSPATSRLLLSLSLLNLTHLRIPRHLLSDILDDIRKFIDSRIDVNDSPHFLVKPAGDLLDALLIVVQSLLLSFILNLLLPFIIIIIVIIIIIIFPFRFFLALRPGLSLLLQGMLAFLHGFLISQPSIRHSLVYFTSGFCEFLHSELQMLPQIFDIAVLEHF